MSRAANAIRGEIASLTCHFIERGLTIDQNFPQCRDVGGQTIVNWSPSANISFAIKGIPYIDIYQRFDAERGYSIKLLDGSLIQLAYQYEGENLRGHRLCYLPSPFSALPQPEDEDTIDSPEPMSLLSEEMFSMVRIDYSPHNSIPFLHSATHMHIGHREHCRVPVSGPVSPGPFVLFILRSFYPDYVISGLEKILTKGDIFKASIQAEEMTEAYFKMPHTTD